MTAYLQKIKLAVYFIPVDHDKSLPAFQMKKREKIASYIGSFAQLVKEAAKGRPARQNKKTKKGKAKKKK